MEFFDFFRIATGNPPFPYQERLALAETWPLLLEVPTGGGKTATVVLAWLWWRHQDGDFRDRIPDRVVYCLPMRSLVEQTHRAIARWLDNLKSYLKEDVEVHKLMGGEISRDWDDRLDRATILVGTQDQLLSRALNRGYATSRYRWPVHFAELNNDCLWIIDETQLMGAGLRTTAQLQWLREHLGTYGTTRTLWMSATLDSGILATVDYRDNYGDLGQPFGLTEDDERDPTLQKRLTATKSLRVAQTVVPGKQGDKDVRDYARQLAAEISETHRSDTLTLVVCNRVNRAQAVYRELRQLRDKGQLDAEIGLIHSRFRAGDREKLGEMYLKDKGDPSRFQGILVATQVVEAGVDISATTLFTELCPWSSFVQRLGRCNRYGDDNDAVSYWIDLDDKAAIPYTLEAVKQARDLVRQLQDERGNAGIQSLKAFLKALPKEKRPRQPVEGMVLRRHDLFQLFDTSSDLAGHDIDISPFVRETEDSDVEIAWRDWGRGDPSVDSGDENYCGKLHRDELCRVSIGPAREFLKKREAWRFDPREKKWSRVEASDLFPGMTLLARKTDGGYSSDLGFTGGKEKDFKQLDDQLDQALNADRDDPLSQVGEYVTLEEHARDTFAEARKLCDALKLTDLPVETIARAARYHDAGKAHPDFQKMLTWNREDRKGETLWAKSDHDFKKNPADRPPNNPKHRGFRYLRHEWASALLALNQGEDFLLAYLVACHHGKVRMVVQPYPNESAPPDGRAYARGVWEGDSLPEIDLGDGVNIPSCELSLQCVALGDGENGEESWVARSLDLLDEYGAFKLAYLETVVRVADWRASAKYGLLQEE